MPVKKTTKKTAVKKTAKNGAPAAGAAAKRVPNAAFMAPMLVTKALQAIVGTKPLARTEITKKVWDYIKANGMQDAVNRRQINPSLLLVAVIGDQPVTIFELTDLISKHILGRADAA